VRIVRVLSILVIFFLTVSWAPQAFADEDALLFAQAKTEAKKGQDEFAFMHYRSILRDYPSSRFILPSSFSQAEYYFLLADYQKASSLFQELIQLYPDSQEKLFALAHLLKIAQLQEDQAMIHQWEKEILTIKPTSFIFRDKKQFVYRTPLNRFFKAVFRINQIDFFQGEKLFVQIIY